MKSVTVFSFLKEELLHSLNSRMRTSNKVSVDNAFISWMLSGPSQKRDSNSLNLSSPEVPPVDEAVAVAPATTGAEDAVEVDVGLAIAAPPEAGMIPLLVELDEGEDEFPFVAELLIIIKVS